MAWIFAIVVIFLLVVSNGFRKFVLIAAVCVGVFLWWLSESAEDQREKSRSMIAESEIEIRKPRLNDDLSNLSGEIKNNSTYALKSIGVEVIISDCSKGVQHPKKPWEKSYCEVIGQEEVAIKTSIPSGQARKFSTFLSFSNMPRIKGHIEWSYRIDYIEAEYQE